MSHSSNVLVAALIAATFFPYLTPVSTPFSLQPYSLMLAIPLLLSSTFFSARIPRWLWLATLPLIGALALWAYSGSSLNAIRSIYNYASVAVLLPMYVFLLRHQAVDVKFWVRAGSVMYFLAGFIQIVFDNTFLSCCVANIQDQSELLASGRGVASMAPEPTFLGFICGVLILIAVVIKDRSAVLLNLVSLIFISRSSLAILCFAVAGLIYLVLRSDQKIKLVTGLVLIAVIPLLPLLFSLDARVVSLFLLALDQGPSGVLTDESAAGRFYHIAQPIKSFVDSYGFPHGFIGLPNGDMRILSGFGSAVYELGVFSIPLFYMFIKAFKASHPSVAKYRVLCFGFLLVAWVNANQLGMPLMLFFLAILIAGTPQPKIYAIEGEANVRRTARKCD